MWASTPFCHQVRKQKLSEAQDISEAVLDAEVRIGELMAKVPKSPGGRPEKTIRSGAISFQPTKKEVMEEAGFNKDQVQRFETLAAHPEAVAQAEVIDRNIHLLSGQQMPVFTGILKTVPAGRTLYKDTGGRSTTQDLLCAARIFISKWCMESVSAFYAPFYLI